MWQMEVPPGAEPLGYKKLIDFYHLKTLSHFRWSYVSPKWEKRNVYFKDLNLKIVIYPPSFNLSDSVFDHLEFALKHEGMNLLILKMVLKILPEADMIAYISLHSTGKYARILWYLYEKFNKIELAIPDLKQGEYIPLLNTKDYYTTKPRRSSRHRIADNLLGSPDFSPLVRKSDVIKEFEKKGVEQTAREVVKKYDPLLLARAMKYLYTKETMSSWEIEREKPDNTKLIKFINLLHDADSLGRLSKEKLVDLQKNIVDSRFASSSYRDFQNYVGEEPLPGQIILHYICPKPQDVEELMNQLIHSFELMEKSETHPVVATAILSFIFVYIHPFEDGNGRLHRFLIHYALSRLKFTPEGMVFPVSATILRDIKIYDKILELFSKPLLDLITNYKINERGEMEVLQETADFYRYLDLTPEVEYLYGCIDKTIALDFEKELAFLAGYVTSKRLCKEVVDMPDQKLNLFIKCVHQNGGVLSLKKREAYFKMLTDEEIKKMEQIIGASSHDTPMI